MIVEADGDVIKLKGPLERDHSDLVRTTLSMTLRQHPTGVIIDLGKLTTITPQGAETLQNAIDFVLDHDKARIIFVNVPQAIEDTMRQVPEVRSQMAISESIESARQSIDLLFTEDRKESPKREKFHRTILVCLSNKLGDEHTMALTHELATATPSKVIVVMPVVVPRELPLQAQVAEEEEIAIDKIECAKSKLEKLSIPHEVRLERTRDLSTLLAELAEEVDASHVVIGITADESNLDETTAMVAKLLSKVKRSLVFAKAAEKVHVPY